MIPVAKAITVYTMVGTWCTEEHPKLKPTLESCGHAIAYDPETHSFAAMGMTVEQYRADPYVVLRWSDKYCPKWENYQAMTRDKLVESWQKHSRAASNVEVRHSEVRRFQ